MTQLDRNPGGRPLPAGMRYSRCEGTNREGKRCERDGLVKIGKRYRCRWHPETKG